MYTSHKGVHQIEPTMNKKPALSRRHFVKNSMVLTAGLPLAGTLPAWATPAQQQPIPPASIPLQWLDGKAPALPGGVTWGTPWPKGTIAKNTAFALQQANGTQLPLQSWPLAYWPDGSLKWTAHAFAWQQPLTGPLQLITTRAPATGATPMAIENNDTITIHTGAITATIPKKGSTIIQSLTRNGKTIAQEGKLILHTRTNPDNEPGTPTANETFTGAITTATLGQNGPTRTVIKIEGRHAGAAGRSWLPFVLRLYFYHNSDAIRILHTITFDGDEQKDFISGLGIRFSVPMQEELHNRHIRFTGEAQGIFAEAVRGLTGLRRDPGQAITDAQVAGKATPPISQFPPAVAQRLQYIPAFGDYTLLQASPLAFDIQKRTRAGYGWVQAAHGTRSSGMAYLGTPTGGIALGIRNCWQSYPAQLDIRNAHTENEFSPLPPGSRSLSGGRGPELTAWLWAPKANPMDLRFYHDGMGQDTFEKQREGLEITYEDYEPGFGSPVGVARTSELMLHVLPATPSNQQLANMAAALQQPPLLVAAPATYTEAGVFGTSWNQPPIPSPKKEAFEKQLAWYFDFYQQQVQQQHWYGFWNYGDVMHSYDKDRHTWKYDIGGFAWDNSELSTDLWLWYYFLHTGQADVFRMAEAMTRHTGEVDVHHLGPFSPLGSRHNVQHWGCSAKQLRISTVANRRFYYYLTADDRVGDLMREQVEAVRTLRTIVPGRKLGQQPATQEGFASVSFGTDWGAIAAAWLTEWERTGNEQIRDRLLHSMHTIGQQPFGFFTGTANMELNTGKFQLMDKARPQASHLSAVFGLAEICAELIALTDIPAFEKAWLQYCELYNASPEEQQAALGTGLGKLNLQQAHARLTAFAARRKQDNRLAARAWKEFYEGGAGIRKPIPSVQHLVGPEVLNPVDEADNISTNAVAQWGLTALMLLGFIGPSLPDDAKS